MNLPVTSERTSPVVKSPHFHYLLTSQQHLSQICTLRLHTKTRQGHQTTGMGKLLEKCWESTKNQRKNSQDTIPWSHLTFGGIAPGQELPENQAAGIHVNAQEGVAVEANRTLQHFWSHVTTSSNLAMDRGWLSHRGEESIWSTLIIQPVIKL